MKTGRKRRKILEQADVRVITLGPVGVHFVSYLNEMYTNKVIRFVIRLYVSIDVASLSITSRQSIVVSGDRSDNTEYNAGVQRDVTKPFPNSEHGTSENRRNIFLRKKKK